MHLHSLSTRGFKKVIWVNLGVAIFKLTDLEVNHLIYILTQDQKLNPQEMLFLRAARQLHLGHSNLIIEKSKNIVHNLIIENIKPLVHTRHN